MRISLILVTAVLAACTFTPGTPIDPKGVYPQAKVKPGISVLISDSVALIKGKRVGLLTNQSGVDEKATSSVDLLGRTGSSGANLVMIFSPEHGFMADQDRPNVASSKERSTGLPVYSLYGASTLPPPDSLMQQLDVLVIDLPDVGVRTWTYEGAMVYALRAAARNKKKVLVLDRPNPLNGEVVEGPMLDSALASSADPTPTQPGLDYALYPIPLRHGMTMGELARFYNAVLNINADLSVIPMRGWKRDVWYDRTGLPWIRPSPNMHSFYSALLYPALVPFEGTNLSVGRGTVEAFQRIGAPWLRADSVVKLLRDYGASGGGGIRGVALTAEPFTPQSPSDGKYAGQKIPGIRITVTNRSELNTTRLFAALFWAINKTSPSDFKVDNRAFDLRLGSPAMREALMRGDDPDTIVDQLYKSVYTFRNSVKKYFLYR